MSSMISLPSQRDTITKSNHSITKIKHNKYNMKTIMDLSLLKKINLPHFPSQEISPYNYLLRVLINKWFNTKAQGDVYLPLWILQNHLITIQDPYHERKHKTHLKDIMVKYLSDKLLSRPRVGKENAPTRYTNHLDSSKRNILIGLYWTHVQQRCRLLGISTIISTFLISKEL